MMTGEDRVAILLRFRGVRGEPCSACGGAGCRWYGSTATWRGGMGGAACRRDVCDVCWGSGSAEEPWLDLRKLQAEENERIALRAGQLFADRCGTGLRSLLPALEALCDELDRFERQRRPRPPSFDLVARMLSKLLRELVAAKRAEMLREFEERKP